MYHSVYVAFICLHVMRAFWAPCCTTSHGRSVMVAYLFYSHCPPCSFDNGLGPESGARSHRFCYDPRLVIVVGRKRHETRFWPEDATGVCYEGCYVNWYCFDNLLTTYGPCDVYLVAVPRCRQARGMIGGFRQGLFRGQQNMVTRIPCARTSDIVDPETPNASPAVRPEPLQIRRQGDVECCL